MELEELKEKHKQEIIDKLKDIYTTYVFGPPSKELFIHILNLKFEEIENLLKLI